MHVATPTPSSKTVRTPSMEDPKLFDPRYRASFLIVTALFFLWALPNNLNDVLIRQFMKSFQLSRLQGGLVQSAFFLGYFCFSMPAAFVLRRYGYRIGLITGPRSLCIGLCAFLACCDCEPVCVLPVRAVRDRFGACVSRNRRGLFYCAAGRCGELVRDA